jgi:DNA invertase Pin-like site-specific DNA recombinase
MNVAIYIRVSTELQTTINQDHFVKDYLTRLGHTIYDTYIDTYKGTKDSRPDFNRLMRDMRLHKFDAIAVYKLDRIGRSTKHLI